jgi:hypothetical protein
MHPDSIPVRARWQSRSIVFVARRCLWLLGLTVWAAPQAAWAQAQPPAQGHSDVMAYMLIVFCVALGMIILLRSAGRTSEVRLEDLDDE